MSHQDSDQDLSHGGNSDMEPGQHEEGNALPGYGEFFHEHDWAWGHDLVEDVSYEDDEFDDMDDYDDEWLSGDESLDGLSEASSLEHELEKTMSIRVAEETADRAFLTPPAAYVFPSASHHFQAADCLAAFPLPDGSNLLATADSRGVFLFRMPKPQELKYLGVVSDPMQFVGGFDYVSEAPVYSIAFSTQGNFLATGSEEGELNIFHVDSTAPQRPPVDRDAAVDFKYYFPTFYAPLAPPDSNWATGAYHPIARERFEAAVAATGLKSLLSKEDYVGSIEDARFLEIVGLHPYDFLLAENMTYDSSPWDMENLMTEYDFGKEGWGTQRGLLDGFLRMKKSFLEFSNMIGGTHNIHWKVAERTRGDSEDDTVSVSSSSSCQRGAVALGCRIMVGHPSEISAKEEVHYLHSMVNGVRFGLVGGQERLLAAEQSGDVYVFELPPLGQVLGDEDTYTTLMCQELGPESPHWRLRPVNIIPGKPSPIGTLLRRRARTVNTVALGPYGTPCNLAVPSPDGKWIAIVCDKSVVYLVDQSDGYSHRDLPFNSGNIYPANFGDPEVAPGAQYAAWNASSSLLAVTSDALHSVYLFSLPSGDQIMRIEGFVRSVLPVVFAPWDDRLVIFAEDSKQVHVRRVSEPDKRGPPVSENAREQLAEAAPGSQLIRIPNCEVKRRDITEAFLNANPRRKITGLDVTCVGDLLITTQQGALYRYLAATEWSTATTKLWPKRFQETVRTLLLCGGRVGLPSEVIQRIIAMVAGKRSDWLVVRKGWPL